MQYICPIHICVPRHIQHARSEARVLFPIIARMEMDTKERTKFFCLSCQRACGCGSGLRRGHSAMRSCTPHALRQDLPIKRRLACDNSLPADVVEAAGASLKRRGLHPERQCTALNGLRYAVLHWPNRIFHGLFAYDVMHVVLINCIGYLLDTLIDVLKPRQLLELDRRNKSLPRFRRTDGAPSRHPKKLSSSANLTAEMKVVHLFVLPHALGSKAMLLDARYRTPVMQAITSLQTICYCARGLRPFTMEEQRYVFHTLGKIFFRALSWLQDVKRRDRINAALSYNEGKPPAKHRRVPHWREIHPPTDESSDTASSSDEGVAPYFLRSDKVIPHAFVHFPDQVRMGGTQWFHDTASAESSHLMNLKLAGARSRVYGCAFQSCASMMRYNNDSVMLAEICRQAKIGTCRVTYVLYVPYIYPVCIPNIYSCFPIHIPNTYSCFRIYIPKIYIMLSNTYTQYI